MDQQQKKKFIDIENIFRSKNPKLHKLLPNFILNRIKKIVHENEVNAFIEKHGHKYDFDFARAVTEYFEINIRVCGIENVPSTGGVVMACNHPLGGLDAMVLLHAVSVKRKDVKFLVNDILLQLRNLRDLFVGVNKHGKNSSDLISNLEQLYASDQGIFIFPAGLVSRKQDGVIKDLEWKKSFIGKARKHRRNIIPVHIEGKNTDKFYNLALWRKKIGIKANIEMLFLVDEMYKQKNKTITIIFGKPLSYEIFDKRFSDHQWAQKVKEHVYALHSGHKSKMITE